MHRFNRAQQDALLPAVESGLLTLIGATTENPYFEVNPPLLSRSTLFRLEPLGPGPSATLDATAASTSCGLAADDDAVAQLAELAGGDARHALGVPGGGRRAGAGPTTDASRPGRRSPTWRRRSAPRPCATASTATTTPSAR